MEGSKCSSGGFCLSGIIHPINDKKRRFRATSESRYYKKSKNFSSNVGRTVMNAVGASLPLGSFAWISSLTYVY